MTRKAFNTNTVSSSGPYSHVTDAETSCTSQDKQLKIVWMLQKT